MAMTRDCKSLAFGLRRFESYFQHHVCYLNAAIAQLAERIHGKDEVTGSNPVRGSIFCHKKYLGIFL